MFPNFQRYFSNKSAKNHFSSLHRLPSPRKANPRPGPFVQANRHQLRRLHHNWVAEDSPRQPKRKRNSPRTQSHHGLNRHRQERHDQLQRIRSRLPGKLNHAQWEIPETRFPIFRQGQKRQDIQKRVQVNPRRSRSHAAPRKGHRWACGILR